MRVYTISLAIYSVAVTVLAFLLMIQNRELKKGPAQTVDTRIHDFDLQDVPLMGIANAKATLVVFSDFECQFCANSYEVLKRLSADYPRDLRVGFKNMPLSFHKNARSAAFAALAAFRQDRFWEMADRLFANQAELGESLYSKIAEDLGLNLERFDAERMPDNWKDYLLQQQEEAERAGVAGTPTYFLNGIKVTGTSYEALRQAIDKALSGS
jgi:protein-disulfide isomerase